MDLRGGKPLYFGGLEVLASHNLLSNFSRCTKIRKLHKIWISVKALETFTAFKDITIDVLEYEHAPAMTLVDSSRSFTQPSRPPFYQVKARLEEESDPDWLMVIDGLEDLPARYHIGQLLPQCDHGTIILTTTRSDLASIVKAPGIEVCGINEAAGIQLLLERFQVGEFSAEGMDCTNPLDRRITD